MKPRTLYLSGPMSGITDLNYPAFNAEAARLRALGYIVLNPAENVPDPYGPWEGNMKTAIHTLLEADAVAVLPGWEDSTGAQVEVALAKTLKLPVYLSVNIQDNTLRKPLFVKAIIRAIAA